MQNFRNVSLQETLSEPEGEHGICNIELPHLRIYQIAFDKGIAKAHHIRGAAQIELAAYFLLIKPCVNARNDGSKKIHLIAGKRFYLFHINCLVGTFYFLK